MTTPTELSIESVRNFMLANGGKVTNHDIVKHFKHFLTNPETRVEARNHFKEIVNAVATIRTEDGEKYIVLKRKYQLNEDGSTSPAGIIYPTSPAYVTSPINSVGLPILTHDYAPIQNQHYANNNYSSPPPNYATTELNSAIRTSPARQPPPYRAPPPPVVYSPRTPSQVPIMQSASVRSPRPPPITALLSEQEADAELARAPSMDSADGGDDLLDSRATAPPVPPRRRSSVKLSKADKENIDENLNQVKQRPKSCSESNDLKDQVEGEPEQKISVRDAMQKFNRLASENELNRVQEPNVLGRKKTQADNKRSPADDDDTASVTLLDPKSREWLVRAAQCDYQRLARMSSENPRLACFKDPSNTALHWAAKHGSEDIVKLIAGTHQANVNIRSNGGYSALHIAMMFGHEDIYNLLVQVYGADQNMRDWSGRKPRQYQASQDTAVSADTFRKIKARKKSSEKDLGFLRIGSLNVRVKRTTEAFSNFLGVGQPNTDKLHKSWGSADNLPQRGDRRMMPPPSFAPIKKRKSKRAQDFSSSHSTATPYQHRASAPPTTNDIDRDRDSDSDGAAGFDSNWHNSAA